MRVVVDERQRIAVEDGENLRALAVVAPSRGDAVRALEAAGLGRPVEGADAVWLRIDELHDAALSSAAPAEPEAWETGWAAMLEFAGGRGWISSCGAYVRAHVEAGSQAGA